MAKLEILKYPDPRLRTKAKKVEEVDDRIRGIIDDLFETMYDAPGIGLAATQVNIHERILVVDVSEGQQQPCTFINPEITPLDGLHEYQEGCLSVPEIYETVTRTDRIRVNALDRQGQPFEIEADGLLSTCIQHEVDHLDGKLFVDYLSNLKRQRIRKRMEKQERNQAS